MPTSVSDLTRADLLNTVAKPRPAKAKATSNGVARAARLLRLAVERSGTAYKTLGSNKGRTTRLLDGTHDDRLWFHQMLDEWGPEVWAELLPLIALEVCAGRFKVVRSISIREESA